MLAILDAVQVDQSTLYPVMAATLTAIGSALVTYLGVRRAKSGRINSTEADALWDEARAIRQEYLSRLDKLQQRLDADEAEIARLRAALADRDAQLATLRAELALRDAKIASLEAQVEALRAENIELRQRKQDKPAMPEAKGEP